MNTSTLAKRVGLPTWTVKIKLKSYGFSVKKNGDGRKYILSDADVSLFEKKLQKEEAQKPIGMNTSTLAKRVGLPTRTVNTKLKSYGFTPKKNIDGRKYILSDADVSLFEKKLQGEEAQKPIGMNKSTLAKRVGLPTWAVKKKLKSYGFTLKKSIDGRKYILSDADVSLFEKKLQKEEALKPVGIKANAIAKKIGSSLSTVKKKLKNYGFTVKKNGDGRKYILSDADLSLFEKKLQEDCRRRNSFAVPSVSFLEKNEYKNEDKVKLLSQNGSFIIKEKLYRKKHKSYVHQHYQLMDAKSKKLFEACCSTRLPKESKESIERHLKSKEEILLYYTKLEHDDRIVVSQVQ